MKLHLWGTDHRRGSNDFRSRLFLSDDQKKAKIDKLLSLGFQDLVYLNTCHRIEFYTTAPDFFSDTRGLWTKLLNEFDLAPEDFYRGYHLEGKSALRHLLRVACSLESLVIGEPQILGQLREAFFWSKENYPVHSSLEKCFHLAFETAKKVRTETEIGQKSVSIATLALSRFELLEKDYQASQVVFVGRSPIVVQIANWFHKNRPETKCLWVNRDLTTLAAIPESQYCQTQSLQDFLQSPPAFQYLFTATSSKEVLFHADFFKKQTRLHTVFDLAQPPDVADSGLSANTLVLRMEDFALEAKNNAKSRLESIEQAEKMIDSAIRVFCLEQKQSPVLKEFSEIETVLIKDLESLFSDMKKAFPLEQEQDLWKWSYRLVKKSLHESREHLRKILSHSADSESHFL